MPEPDSEPASEPIAAVIATEAASNMKRDCRDGEDSPEKYSPDEELALAASPVIGSSADDDENENP